MQLFKNISQQKVRLKSEIHELLTTYFSFSNSGTEDVKFRQTTPIRGPEPKNPEENNSRWLQRHKKKSATNQEENNCLKT